MVFISRNMSNNETTFNKKFTTSPSHSLIEMSREEYSAPIQTDYAKHLAQLKPEEIYDNYNPGPSKPDGSVNFECHCVGHLVGSPCGFEFRKAISCQKVAGEDAMEKGACADEFMAFMQCAIETKCFHASSESATKDRE